MTTMRRLLWKDLRMTRSLQLAAAGLLVIPAILALAATMLLDSKPLTGGLAWEWFDQQVRWFSQIAAQFVAISVPAIMFTRERRERTAELTETLPVPRSSIVASKAIVALASTAIWWAGIFVLPWIFAAARHLMHNGAPFVPENINYYFSLLPLLTMNFGMAWLLSAILRSESFATWITILATVATGIAAISMPSAAVAAQLAWLRLLLVVICTSGMLAFVAGTVIAIRRQTP